MRLASMTSRKLSPLAIPITDWYSGSNVSMDRSTTAWGQPRQVGRDQHPCSLSASTDRSTTAREYPAQVGRHPHAHTMCSQCHDDKWTVIRMYKLCVHSVMMNASGSHPHVHTLCSQYHDEHKWTIISIYILCVHSIMMNTSGPSSACTY